MDDLLEHFLVEGRELVAEANQGLMVLSSDPGNAAALDGTFRAFHTLKGSVAIFALEPAERLLHAAEDVLERARKRNAPLNGQSVAALIACLDQTDRWIDAMEADGALPPDALAVSERIVATLVAGGGASEPELPVVAGPVDWVAALAERAAQIIAAAETPLIAFRYAPDADCFFRGDDPLAVAGAVPQLLTLSVLPVDVIWPVVEDIDPFRCFTVLEGLSAAGEDEVRAAFRMQSRQVEFAVVAPQAKPERREEHAATTVMRVEFTRIDAMADRLGELVIGINALTPLANEAQAIDRELAARIRAVQANIERATAKLHRDLNAVRMVPLEPSLRRLPRLAREIADGLGKSARLTITGEKLEVDKQIADSLFEPLLHLVRNAIDHGMEPAEQREADGKPREGSIDLAFRREGDNVIVTLRDDGAGIDPSRIRATALDRGLISNKQAEGIDDAAALQLIFAPGFSTSSAVTEISGRGVGMDAVRTGIEKLRGSIDIDSEVGKGTTFRMVLPANALTTRLIVVEAGGERYGVSLDQVVETVRVGTDALMPVGGGIACVLRDRTVPVFDLAALLGAGRIEGDHAKLIVSQVRGAPVALRVDGFAERIDTIVRPPSGMLASAPGIIGSALMGDGGVLLVLDLPELAA